MGDERNFGINLKKIMHSRGISCNNLAEMCSVSSMSVRRWIQLEAIPNLFYVYLVADALKVDVCDLLKGITE